MSDIETIGISLVLDNGVAEGLRRVTQDMARFNRQTELTATRMHRLAQRHLGPYLPPDRDTARPSPVAPSATRPTAKDARPVPPEETAQPAAMPAPTPPAASPPAPRSGVAPPSRASATPLLSPAGQTIPRRAEAIPTRPSMAQPKVGHPVTLPTAAPLPHRNAVTHQQTKPILPPPPPASSRAQSPSPPAPPRPKIQIALSNRDAGPAPPRTTPARPAAAPQRLNEAGRITDSERPSRPPAPVMRAPPLTAPATGPRVASDDRGLRPVAPPREAPRSPPVTNRTAMSAIPPSVPPLSRPLSPTAADTPIRMPAADHAAAMPAPTSSTAPMAPPAPPSAAATAMLHGNLMIDGAQIGRWLAETMARQASRPPTTARRFNTRMTPAWPGTPL